MASSATKRPEFICKWPPRQQRVQMASLATTVKPLGYRDGKRNRVTGIQMQMASSAITVEPQPVRRSGNYPPTIWDAAYIQSLRSDFSEDHNIRIEKLKEYARKLILEKKETVKQLELVDTLEQLGVAYHFEEEIIDVLENIHISMEEVTVEMEGDLYRKALLFRLLREHCFTVSQDVFNSFKDEAGNFDSRLIQDPRGLLSLHKASYYAIEGEETLDEAREFTAMHLNNLIKTGEDFLDTPLAEHTTYTLDLPLNWRWNRAHCRWYIQMYDREDCKNPTLVELAKLDFNRVQSIYAGEIKELSRWWSDLNLCGAKLSFARSRFLESYLAAAGCISDPKWSRPRKAMTKFICLLPVTDDIYDVYGTLEELELFTAAVERWEVGAIGQLPEYMKILFLVIFNAANGVAYETLRDKGIDILPYLKGMWIEYTKSLMVEAKWYHTQYTPTFREYLENASISSSINMVLTVVYCVNEDITIEDLKGFTSYHAEKMLQPSIIARLCNDLETSTDELQRGDAPKAVQCYMHEKEVLECVAQKHIWDLINLSWKRLNREGFASTPFAKLLRSCAFNSARTAHLFYQHGDGFGFNTDRDTKGHIISLFIEPILF